LFKDENLLNEGIILFARIISNVFMFRILVVAIIIASASRSDMIRPQNLML
jgi:hypothetical protein